MGGAVSSGRDNNELVDNLMGGNYIRSPAVERVFRSLDRADYMTPNARDQAYKDLAWRDNLLHMSAPCIYSEVMEGLELRPGLSFLNIGSGTGYLSTLVGLILGAGGINHGVEIYPAVFEYANKKLSQFLENSASLDEFELCEPKFFLGNGLCLAPLQSPYDRVYCGAGCPEEYQNYFKHLIKVGGILVMPLNDNLLQVRRVSTDEWTTQVLLNVSFAPLRVPTKDESTKLVKLEEQTPPRLQLLARAVIRAAMRGGLLRRHPELRDTQPRQPPAKKSCPRRICIPIEDDSDVEGLNALHDLDRDGGAHEMNALLSLVLNMGENRVAGALRFSTEDSSSSEEDEDEIVGTEDDDDDDDDDDEVGAERNNFHFEGPDPDEDIFHVANTNVDVPSIGSDEVRNENVRNEDVKNEGVGNDGARNESARTDCVRNESVRNEGVRTEGDRNEGVRSEGVRNDSARNESVKSEDAKNDDDMSVEYGISISSVRFLLGLENGVSASQPDENKSATASDTKQNPGGSGDSKKPSNDNDDVPAEVEIFLGKTGDGVPGTSRGGATELQADGASAPVDSMNQSSDEETGESSTPNKDKHKFDSGIGEENTPSCDSSPTKAESNKTDESDAGDRSNRSDSMMDDTDDTDGIGWRSRSRSRSRSRRAGVGRSSSTEGSAAGSAGSATSATGAPLDPVLRECPARRAKRRAADGGDARRVRLSIMMKRAVRELPLPYVLKKFVNWGRCFQF